jgi:hypothetical protein
VNQELDISPKLRKKYRKMGTNSKKEDEKPIIASVQLSTRNKDFTEITKLNLDTCLRRSSDYPGFSKDEGLIDEKPEVNMTPQDATQ